MNRNDNYVISIHMARIVSLLPGPKNKTKVGRRDGTCVKRRTKLWAWANPPALTTQGSKPGLSQFNQDVWSTFFFLKLIFEIKGGIVQDFTGNGQSRCHLMLDINKQEHFGHKSNRDRRHLAECIHGLCSFTSPNSQIKTYYSCVISSGFVI